MTRFSKTVLTDSISQAQNSARQFCTITVSWQKVIIPFQGASNNVSLCGKYSSGIIFYIRAAEARWSNWSQVT